MDNRLPLPTDNIYKFYALFGLLLLIAAMLGFVQLHNSTNEEAFQRYVEIETLRALPARTAEQDARKRVLEAQSDIARSDRQFYSNTFAFLASVAIVVSGFGFFEWHRKIQPIQDALMARQLEKIELEIADLRRAKLRARV